jgi:AcrR family transcriptional regulator
VIDPAHGLTLQQRRNRQTDREIRDAALTLFERQGVAATTADEIATAAGISPRTFFRRCRTKEEAVLLGDGDLHDGLVRDLRAAAPLPATITALEPVWRAVFLAFDADEPWRTLTARLMDVAAEEPGLRAAMARRAEERRAELVAVVGEATGADAMRAAALVALFDTVAGLTVQESRRRAAQGQDPAVLDAYRAALATIREIAQEL